MDTNETKNQGTPANFETNESHNQVAQVKTNDPMDNQRVMVDSSRQVESINCKIKYERCTSRAKCSSRKYQARDFKD